MKVAVRTKTELPWAQRVPTTPVPRFPKTMAVKVTTERMRLVLMMEAWMKALRWVVTLEEEPTLAYTPVLRTFEDTKEHHPFSGCETGRKRRNHRIHQPPDTQSLGYTSALAMWENAWARKL